MRLLAFDTSMQACSVAVEIIRHEQKSSLHQCFEPMQQGHAERLLPMIGEVLADAGLAIGDIDRIAVTLGPGSFTGVRIGIATARGLALATGADLVGDSSLRLIALQYMATHAVAPDDLICVAVDARRGQLYCQQFEGLAARSEGPCVLTPEGLVRSLPPDKRIHLVGNGALRLREAAARPGFEAAVPQDVATEPTLPNAVYLLPIASVMRVSDTPLRPLYLRPPDAKAQTGYALERRDAGGPA